MRMAERQRFGNSLAESDGNVAVELMFAMPIVIIGLLMMVNIMGYTAECAKFDRVAGEVARTAVLHRDANLSAKLTTCMAFDAKSRSRVTAVPSPAGGPLGTDYVKVTCTLFYSPWPRPSLSVFDGTSLAFKLPSTEWKHTQSFVFDRYKPGVVF